MQTRICFFPYDGGSIILTNSIPHVQRVPSPMKYVITSKWMLKAFPYIDIDHIVLHTSAHLCVKKVNSILSPKSYELFFFLKVYSSWLIMTRSKDVKDFIFLKSSTKDMIWSTLEHNSIDPIEWSTLFYYSIILFIIEVRWHMSYHKIVCYINKPRSLNGNNKQFFIWEGIFY